jgi:Uma2 family endonuclease
LNVAEDQSGCVTDGGSTGDGAEYELEPDATHLRVTAVSVKTLMTAEDFLQMPDEPGKPYELVRGELVEMPGATALHGDVSDLIREVLKGFVRQHRLGRVFGDGAGYIVARDRDVVRVPDVSFVAQYRIPETGVPDTFWPFAPDLTVEIVSAGDREVKVHENVREYLDAGSRLVWVARPKTRSVTAHAADGPLVEFGPDDELDGGDVLPGFCVRAAALFAIGD